MDIKKSRGKIALEELKKKNSEIRKLMDDIKALERSLTNCFTELSVQHKRRRK